MNKIIKFHFSNDRVIAINLHQEHEDILKILDKQWFISFDPMTKKYTCVNLGKVIFIEVGDE